MKKTLIILVGMALLLLAGSGSFADIFKIQVTIQEANDANFIVYKIFDPRTFPTTPETSTDLTFTTHFDSINNTFLGDFYYAINVQPTGGAGGVNVKINYADVSWPTGQTIKLGEKATIAAAAVNSKTNAEASLMLRSLIAADNFTVLASSLPTGNYLRFYVGLATGSEPVSVGVVPFNTGDKPGTYVGTLTLTALTP